MMLAKNSLKIVRVTNPARLLAVLKIRFQDDKYAPFFAPEAATAPNATNESPSYEELSQTEFETLLAEMEGDIRGADRDLREIEDLDSRGSSAAGRLPGASRAHMKTGCRIIHWKPILEHESLRARLGVVQESLRNDLEQFDILEHRIGIILQAYASQVSVLHKICRGTIVFPYPRSIRSLNYSFPGTIFSRKRRNA
jgi:hypothetical protein